jgi:hypothetical protein
MFQACLYADRFVLYEWEFLGHPHTGGAPGGRRSWPPSASLNHRLHRNINSARNYERPIDLVIGRTAQQPLLTLSLR